MKKTEKKQAPRTKHALLKPHRHGGSDYAAGDKVDLTDCQVKRLQKAEIIKA